jgi:competence protein ComEA
VTDGEQIIVSNSLGVVAKTSASKLLSLNSATVTDLEALPGVGPTLAGRIIDWKAANGNFSTVEDLLKVSGIGDKLFARIRTMVRP